MATAPDRGSRSVDSSRAQLGGRGEIAEPRTADRLRLRCVGRLRVSAAQTGSAARRAAAIPDPHGHHYQVERDAEERAVLQELDWRVKPLRESDAQFGRLSRSAAYR